MANNNKILFILKRREDYNKVLHNSPGLSTGLYNSASFVNEMLNSDGITSELEVAIDNNDIDRLITQHKPTHVIIEALWVVPSKFSVLTKLHPNVTWIIRIHSEMPFMANEGIALNWIGGYSTYKNIILAPNSPRMLDEVKTYLKFRNFWKDDEVNKRVIYLPNFYPKEQKIKQHDPNKYWIDIGCFGAIRPLKNHLVQALAALKFAQKHHKQLRFHVNFGRVENKGDPVLHNLQGMFENLHDYGHQLIGHSWTPREEFLKLCGQMDIGMQVSFSETFNIVGADFVSQGVPLVGTEEIPWSSKLFNASPTDSDEIACALTKSYYMPKLNVLINNISLNIYRNKTKEIWKEYFYEA
jgi:hypothetical protein